MWWLVALLLLLCFSALDIVVKSTAPSGNQSPSDYASFPSKIRDVNRASRLMLGSVLAERGKPLDRYEWDANHLLTLTRSVVAILSREPD